MPQEIDVRGLSCPQPAMQLKNAIKKGDFPIVVLSDSAASCDNLTRIAEGDRLQVAVEETGDEFKLTISRQ